MADPSLFDEDETEGELLYGAASARVVRSVVDDRTAAHYFEILKNEVAWQDRELFVFGRSVRQPRLVAWSADSGLPYSYSGLTLDSIEEHPTVARLRALCEELAGCKFNSVLMNLYRDGTDCVSWHSDDEKLFGTEPTIASLSLGATRRFDLRNRDSGEKISTDLNTGDLVIMSGSCQREWEHQIPRQRRVHAARINLTFRKMV